MSIITSLHLLLGVPVKHLQGIIQVTMHPVWHQSSLLCHDPLDALGLAELRL